MLDDAYFQAIGAPDPNRMAHLPLWYLRYEAGLRRQASWWHSVQRGRTPPAALVPECPGSARLLSLPLWAQEWINTLKFEVTWWREKVQPPEPKTIVLHRPAAERQRKLFATPRP